MKKVLKFILCILLVILIAIVINIVRNYVIIKGLSEKASKYEDEKWFHTKYVIDYKGETKIIDIYKTDNERLLSGTTVKQESNTYSGDKLYVFSNKNNEKRSYLETGEYKVYLDGKDDFSKYVGNTAIPAYNLNFKSVFALAFTSIKEVFVNGNKAYKVGPFLLDDEEYRIIDSSNGLIIEERTNIKEEGKTFTRTAKKEYDFKDVSKDIVAIRKDVENDDFVSVKELRKEKTSEVIETIKETFDLEDDVFEEDALEYDEDEVARADSELQTDHQFFKEKTEILFNNYLQKNNLFSIDTQNKYFSAYGIYYPEGDGTGTLDIDCNNVAYGDEAGYQGPGLIKEPVIFRAGVYDECAYNLIKPQYDMEEDLKAQYDVWDKAHKEMRNSPTFSDLPLAKDLKYSFTGLTILNGYNLSDKEYKEYSRAKTIKVTAGDKTKEFTLKDTIEPQLLDFDYTFNDASKPVEIKVEVIDSYEGAVSSDIYVGDILLGLTLNGTHGR